VTVKLRGKSRLSGEEANGARLKGE